MPANVRFPPLTDIRRGPRSKVENDPLRTPEMQCTMIVNGSHLQQLVRRLWYYMDTGRLPIDG